MRIRSKWNSALNSTWTREGAVTGRRAKTVWSDFHIPYASLHTPGLPYVRRRSPFSRTQPLENLTQPSMNKWVPEQPSPWRNSSTREPCNGDRVYGAALDSILQQPSWNNAWFHWARTLILQWWVSCASACLMANFHTHCHYHGDPTAVSPITRSGKCLVASAAGNWTRVSRVTGASTDHYTTADLQYIDVRTIASSISCVAPVSTPLVKGSCFQCWLASDRPGRLAAWEMTHLRNLRLSRFGYGKAGMASMSAIEKEKQRLHKCISRELNPGHIDGNDVFYH